MKELKCPAIHKRNKFHKVTTFRDELWEDPRVDLDYCESACSGVPDEEMKKSGLEKGCEGIREGCKTYELLRGKQLS